MSGISISTKQRYSIVTAVVLLLQFSSIMATEQTVKVTTSQGAATKHSSEEKALQTDNKNVHSQLSSLRTSSYKDVSDPLLLETDTDKASPVKKPTKIRDTSASTQLKSI